MTSVAKTLDSEGSMRSISGSWRDAADSPLRYPVKLYHLSSRTLEGKIKNITVIVTPDGEHELDVYYLAGDFDKTIKEAEKILEKNPADAGALDRKAFSHLMLGQYDEGMETCEKIIALDPNSTRGVTLKGCFLLDAGRVTEAESCFKKACEITSNDHTSVANLANFYWRQGRFGEALQYADLNIANSKDPEEKAGCYLHKIAILKGMGRNPEEVIKEMAAINDKELDKGLEKLSKYTDLGPDTLDTIKKLQEARASMSGNALSRQYADASFRGETIIPDTPQAAPSFLQNTPRP